MAKALQNKAIGRSAARNSDKRGIIDSITIRTKAIALTALIAEALFAVAAYRIPVNDLLYAFYGCVAVLLIALTGCIWLEHRSADQDSLIAGGSKSDWVTLDAARIRDFMTMYQRSLAYAISREIDKTLAQLEKNPDSYDRDFFIECIWRAMLECREEALHFRHADLGPLHDYFSRFTKEQLTTMIANRYEQMLRDTTVDPIDRRRNLFESIENEQALVRDQAMRLIEAKMHNR